MEAANRVLFLFGACDTLTCSHPIKNYAGERSLVIEKSVWKLVLIQNLMNSIELFAERLNLWDFLLFFILLLSTFFFIPFTVRFFILFIFENFYWILVKFKFASNYLSERTSIYREKTSSHSSISYLLTVQFFCTNTKEKKI